jgi:hypothetical protein
MRRSGSAPAAGVRDPSRFARPAIADTRTAPIRVASKADGPPRARRAAVINGAPKGGSTIAITNGPFARVAA